MNIQPFTPDFTGKAVKLSIPRYNKNSEQKYLFNKVSDVIKEHKLPAEIRNEGIEINIADSHYQADTLQKVKDKLTNLGIYFEKSVK